MNKKRFRVSNHGGLFTIFDKGKIIPFMEDGKQLEDTLNQLNDDLEDCKLLNKRCSDAYDRRWESLCHIRREYDILFQLCKDQGLTDDEIIRELER